MAAISVAKGLYMGGEESLQQLGELGITHVLSVVNYDPPPLPDGTCHWRVVVADAEEANLLVELPTAVTWIERALRQKGARLLVHCHAGTSRSAAVVAAAIMRAKRVPAADALALLRARCPAARPNDGFLVQLELWGEMGCEVDPEHPAYKRFCLEQVARQYQEEGWVDPSQFAALPEDAETLDQVTRYCCRKCRQLVATSRNVIPEDAAVGHSAFRARRGGLCAAAPPVASGGGDGEAAPAVDGAGAQEADEAAAAAAAAAAAGGAESGGVFVEPMEWMQGAIVGPVQGKLYCPRCAARVGRFNWAGVTNTAGAWVVPGFQLALSKVDALRPRSQAPLRAISFPARLAARAPPQPEEDFLSDLQHSATSSSAGGNGAAACSGATDGAAAPGPATAWFRALVLDCDGVLVDTERASCASLRQAILQVTGFDIPHEFPRDYEPVFGMDVLSCMEHYKQVHHREEWTDVMQLAAQVQAAKEGIYRRLTSGGIAAFDGAARLIQRARALGMAVGVGSSGAPEKIERNLASSGLAAELQEAPIVSAAYVARGKPAPDVYVEVLRRLGGDDPARALVVEDSVNGLIAGRGAGMFCVGVTNSLSKAALAQHADLVVTHLDEIDLENLVPVVRV